MRYSHEEAVWEADDHQELGAWLNKVVELEIVQMNEQCWEIFIAQECPQGITMTILMEGLTGLLYALFFHQHGLVH